MDIPMEIDVFTMNEPRFDPTTPLPHVALRPSDPRGRRWWSGPLVPLKHRKKMGLHREEWEIVHEGTLGHFQKNKNWEN